MLHPIRKRLFDAWQKVERNPELYKSCENCTSVMPDAQPECPICLCYRFSKDLDIILERVRFHYKRGSFMPPGDPKWLSSGRWKGKQP